MTHTELSTLLREHVQTGEPPLALRPETTILAGRRVLRRRRIRRGTTAAVVIATAAALTPVLLSGDGQDARGIDPATSAALADYDAGAMPGILHRAVQPILAEDAPGLLPDRAFVAADDQGVALKLGSWDRASSMEITYGGEGPHRFRLALLHAKSEAEGNKREQCASEVSSGFAFTCTVTVIGGDTVTTTVAAVRPLPEHDGTWAALTRDELASGIITDTDPSQEPLDRDQVYFLRTVESVHSETFLTVAQEIVKAPNLTQAQAAWRVSDGQLTDLATDPALVIPRPKS